MSALFQGKVFMVTGASSGIGEDIAKRLAADGAHVVLTARREEKLAAVKAAIEAEGGSASVKVLDVLKYEDVEAVVKSIVEETGRLDGAFNNAGGAASQGTIVELDADEFKKTFDLNFYGTYHAMKAELQVMTKQGFGAIVNNLSMLTGLHMGGSAHYGASKLATKYVQEAAALEVAPQGVRVNSVSPGFTRPSEALDAFLEKNPGMEALLANPQGRLGTGQDVYQAVSFLLDDNRSSAITGVDLPISGGHSVAQVAMAKL